MATKSQYWFVFHNEQLLVSSGNEFLSETLVQPLLPHLHYIHTFHETAQTQFICAELSATQTLSSNLLALKLRTALEDFSFDWYNIIIKAYSIINWDKYHSYCGRCAVETQRSAQLFERVCPNCKHLFYPRISPSVIVLIHDEDKILMARSPHFGKGIYGLIAGFIEPGESAEQAVIREVKEEVGINITDLSYFGSQAWPFPDSLMFGFIARFAGGELVLDPTEIEDAGWYHYSQLPGRPSSQISIASKLLNHFIEQRAR